MNTSSKKANWIRITALALMGAGLLALGLAAWALLPGALDGAVAEQADAPSAAPAKVDFPAPSLALTDLQGNPVSLEGLRGGYVLVNHWATWCPPCRAEMPTLQAYYDDHRASGFTLVAINAGESPATAADYVQRAGLTFPVWADPDQKGMDAFRENYLPSSYLIDPSGQVVLYWGGAISRAVLEQYVTPLLEENHGSES